MKNKLITIIVFLLGLFVCCACNVTDGKEVIENSSEQLQIFRSDLKLTQEQLMSKIKAEHLIENKGYLDNDEVGIGSTRKMIEILGKDYKVDSYVVKEAYKLAGINDLVTLKEIEEIYLQNKK